MTSTVGKEIDQLKHLGSGALSLFNAVILVAIIAVVLSNGSATAAVIQQAFALVSWLVSLVVTPVTGGYNVSTSTATLTPAGGTPPLTNPDTGATVPIDPYSQQPYDPAAVSPNPQLFSPPPSVMTAPSGTDPFSQQPNDSAVFPGG